MSGPAFPSRQQRGAPGPQTRESTQDDGVELKPYISQLYTLYLEL